MAKRGARKRRDTDDDPLWVYRRDPRGAGGAVLIYGLWQIWRWIKRKFRRGRST